MMTKEQLEEELRKIDMEIREKQGQFNKVLGKLELLNEQEKNEPTGQ